MKQIIKHKFIAGIILLALIAGGYWGYTKIFGVDAAARYVSARVQKGALIVSISGSGQVSASNQMDIKPKVSGDVAYVGVKNGQEIKAGALIAQLDATDAQKAVRDAETNLESVKLTLEKLKGAETAPIPRNKEKAQADLAKSYEDGFNNVANVFIDLPTVMAGLYDTLFGYNFTASQANLDYYSDAVKNYNESVLQYRNGSYDNYRIARKAYDQNFDDYKSATRFSDTAAIEQLIAQTYDTTKNIAEAIKNASNLIQFYKDKLIERNLKPNSMADTHISALNGYTDKTNSHLLNLLKIKQTIQDGKDAVINADLDIKSQELTVRQRENALLDAKEKLADYSVRAPFGGVIAQLQLEKGDSISPSTVLGILITKQKIAEISLNEIDAARIKTGQKAALTFDAIPELTISGEVAEIDAIGTISQGVVTYNIKIAFDTQDERVKTAMSVSAAIITEAKPDVLLVPNSAIKQQNDGYYVEIFAGETESPRRRQVVQTGLSNDTETEIISGLNEGEIIVTRIIQLTAAQTAQTQTQSSQSGLRIPGLPTSGGSSGGGGFRR